MQATVGHTFESFKYLRSFKVNAFLTYFAYNHQISGFEFLGTKSFRTKEFKAMIFGDSTQKMSKK